jgi:hypothetical protein
MSFADPERQGTPTGEVTPSLRIPGKEVSGSDQMPEDPNKRMAIRMAVGRFRDKQSEVTAGANERAHRFLRTKELRTRLYSTQR